MKISKDVRNITLEGTNTADTTSICHEPTGVTMETDLLVYESVDNSPFRMGKDFRHFLGPTLIRVISPAVSKKENFKSLKISLYPFSRFYRIDSL